MGDYDSDKPMQHVPSPQQACALSEEHCPLCGGPNDCAVARTGKLETRCWCSDVSFSAELLERVPEAQRNRACICPRCAATRK